jgi:formylglycine-generating enzyme required for sulfatase activity
MPNQWPDPTSWSTDPDDWGPVPVGSGDPLRAIWDRVEMVSDSTGYRLPTEAQWEFTAKARSNETPPNGFAFAGSNDPDAVAWHGFNGGGSTRIVGLLAPNALGIYDMSGNVSEWCWDLWGSYTIEAKTNPVGASAGSRSVGRGGSWDSLAVNARSVFRDGFNPFSRHTFFFGFRLVRP